MSLLYVAAAVVIAVLIWPINRKVMREGGTTRLFGFWIAAGGAAVSGPIAVLTGQLRPTAGVWLLGAAIGVAYALGYCLIVMHCLRIGPVGPTVALNNMGMVWAVVAGVVWLKPRPITPGVGLGFAAVAASLALFGFVVRGSGSTRQTSARWLAWALAAWLFAGVSMTCQAIAGTFYPDAPFGVVFAFTLTAALILAPLARTEGRPWIAPPETPGGIASGVVNMLGVAASLAAIRSLGPQIVFPFTVAAPLVIVQALGHFLFGERLDAAGWVACFLGAAGLVALLLP